MADPVYVPCYVCQHEGAHRVMKVDGDLVTLRCALGPMGHEFDIRKADLSGKTVSGVLHDNPDIAGVFSVRS